MHVRMAFVSLPFVVLHNDINAQALLLLAFFAGRQPSNLIQLSSTYTTSKHIATYD